MSLRPLPFHQQIESENPETTDLSAQVLATSPQDGRWNRLLWAWAMLAAVAVAGIFATRASGQAANFPYDSIPMHPALKDQEGNEDEAKVKQLQSVTKNYVSTGKGSVRMVSGYYSFYVPAKMTGPDCLEHISPLVDETNQFLSRAQRSNRVQVAQQLTKAVFDGMRKVVGGNHHPAARISAALILSRLDRQLADTANRVPPVPLTSGVVPILLGVYQDDQNVDGLRAAALQGLHRQVMYGFPQLSANQKQALTTLCTELLDADAPAGRSEDAHAYLQRFAVDILALIRPTQDKTLGVKLISISTEPDNHDLIALHSASRIASMAKELKGQVGTPEAVLESWSRRVLAAFESEFERFQALERPKAARTQPKKPESFLVKPAEVKRSAQPYGSGMEEGMMEMEDYESMMMDGSEYGMEEMEMGYEGMMGMGYGMGMRPEAKPQPPEVIASRQKLNHVLQQLHLGVTGAASAGIPTRGVGGLLGSVEDDKKEVVETWVTTMEAIVTAINDEMLDDREKYVVGLEEQIAALRSFIGIEDEEEAEAKDDEFDPDAEIFGVQEVDMAAPGEAMAAPDDELAPAPAPAGAAADAPAPADAPAAADAPPPADAPAPEDELAAP